MLVVPWVTTPPEGKTDCACAALQPICCTTIARMLTEAPNRFPKLCQLNGDMLLTCANTEPRNNQNLPECVRRPNNPLFRLHMDAVSLLFIMVLPNVLKPRLAEPAQCALRPPFLVSTLPFSWRLKHLHNATLGLLNTIATRASHQAFVTDRSK